MKIRHLRENSTVIARDSKIDKGALKPSGISETTRRNTRDRLRVRQTASSTTSLEEGRGGGEGMNFPVDTGRFIRIIKGEKKVRFRALGPGRIAFVRGEGRCIRRSLADASSVCERKNKRGEEEEEEGGSKLYRELLSRFPCTLARHRNCVDVYNAPADIQRSPRYRSTFSTGNSSLPEISDNVTTEAIRYRDEFCRYFFERSCGSTCGATGRN